MTDMGVNNIVKSGDMFIMDGQSFDIETLLVTLQMERANNINSQLMDQANEMKKKNAILKEAQSALASLRAARPAKGSGKADVPADAAAFASKYGIDFNTGNKNQTEFDQNIENLKGFIDSQNSASQMDMIRLQNLNNKYTQSFDMMTNFIKKFSGSKDNIIRNY
ncbi:hypothetical protein SCOR_08825 [Sulfidibacter corallicola]|uniref:Uncharacterized protein n=1 Tax=Sulfidibacter corallicola TaxID=2818388 RepID=A0A8A4TMC3_SULCO|nr:hypothetical protein [Sulfidibacter corallicola]QTD51139.1 hypothetical protein J3U87_01610 [Sulfidibacter corallicola]